MPPIVILPPGMTPVQRKLWWEALKLQDGDPTLPVGIEPLKHATYPGMSWRRIRNEVEAMERRGLWPFPRPGRGGRHATARFGKHGSKYRKPTVYSSVTLMRLT